MAKENRKAKPEVTDASYTASSVWTPQSQRLSDGPLEQGLRFPHHGGATDTPRSSVASGPGLGRRPDHGPDGGPCHGPGDSPVRAPGPSGGYAQAGGDCHTSSPQKTARHRNEVAPIQPPCMAAESNNLHATCNAFPPDTNSRLPIRTRGRVWEVEWRPQPEAVVGQL
jgi:hypothetical protein